MWRINYQSKPFEKFHHVFWFQSTEYLELFYVTYVCLLIFAKSDVFDDGRTLKLKNKVLKNQ